MSLVARTLQRAQSHREWPLAAQAKACALRLRDLLGTCVKLIDRTEARVISG